MLVVNNRLVTRCPYCPDSPLVIGKELGKPFMALCALCFNETPALEWLQGMTASCAAIDAGADVADAMMATLDGSAHGLAREACVTLLEARDGTRTIDDACRLAEAALAAEATQEKGSD